MAICHLKATCHLPAPQARVVVSGLGGLAEKNQDNNAEKASAGKPHDEMLHLSTGQDG